MSSGKLEVSNNNKNLKDLINEKFYNKVPDINELLIFCTENKCSDLYLNVNNQPYISRYGLLYLVPTFPLTNKIWNEWAKYAISSENNAKYVRQKMLDFSYTIDKDGIEYRYRISAGFSFNSNIASFRMISKELPSFESINFPQNIENILRSIGKKRQKISLIVGATGSGKSTTFAACINDFSKHGGPFENSVIISLEDPIEYKFNKTENVNIIQKELGTDFKEFSLGVKQALREHPNFINVGETRDRETINTLVEASRTGHSVWTSFHATDVADTISRLYNHLINDNSEIMYDLIANMNIILCQRLIPSNNGFKLNIQYMIFTDEIIKFLSNLIECNKNIPNEIHKLFQNQALIKHGIVKDWD